MKNFKLSSIFIVGNFFKDIKNNFLLIDNLKDFYHLEILN